MKIKKIVFTCFFVMLLLGSKKLINVNAESENYIEDNEEIITEDFNQTKRSSVSEEESTIIYVPESHLSEKYGINDWILGRNNTTDSISNGIPVEMKSDGFYEKEVFTKVCQELNLKTTYGGCGPIAMIGMADFFSRYLDYTEIIEDPNDQSKQKALIKEFLKAIRTMEVKKGL